MFLIIGGLNINEKPDRKQANVLNDIILILVFLISSINVIISGFGLSMNVASIQSTNKYTPTKSEWNFQSTMEY